MEINNILSGKSYEAPTANAGKSELKAADAFMSLLNNVDIKGADFQYSFNNLLDNLTPTREKSPIREEKISDVQEKPKAHKKAKAEAEPEQKDNAPVQSEGQNNTNPDNTTNVKKAEVSYTAVPSENNSDYTPTPIETDVGKPNPKMLQTPEAGLQKEGAAVPSIPAEVASAKNAELSNLDTAKNAGTEKAGKENTVEVLPVNAEENIGEVAEKINLKQNKGENKPVEPSAILARNTSVRANIEEKPIILAKNTTEMTPNASENQADYFPESEIKVETNAQDKTILNSGRTPESTPLPSLAIKGETKSEITDIKPPVTEKTAEQVVAKSILDNQKQQLASLAGNDTPVKVKVEAETKVTPETFNVAKDVQKKVAVNTEDYNFEPTEAEVEAEPEALNVKTDTKNAAKPVNSTLNDAQMLKAQDNPVKANSLLNPLPSPEAQTATQSFTTQLKSGAVKVESVTGIENQPLGGSVKTSPAQAATLADNVDTLAKTVKAQKTSPLPQNVRQNILEQVKVNITKAKESGTGLDKIKINLKPKELGSIEVKMEVGNNGHLKTSITATRPETLDALQKDFRVLERALADAGFDMKDNSLSFQLRGENQQQGQQQFAGNNNQRETFINPEINEMTEAEPELFADEFIRGDENGLYAVNIKV